MIEEIIFSPIFMGVNIALAYGFITYGRSKEKRTALIMGYVFLIASLISTICVFGEYYSTMNALMEQLDE